MELLLELGEADELRLLLGQALADLSYEIADTDSWEYRRQLAGERRTASQQPRPGRPEARRRALAHAA